MEKNETIRVLESRVSVRDFRSDPIDDEILDTVLRVACRAPTSSNLQAYTFVAVRDTETRQQLAVLTGNQRHVAEAPVFVAICADLSRVARACELRGTEFQGHTLEMMLVAAIDASLVGMCATVAAESLGLRSVMIGGARNEPIKVAQLLGLPQRCFVVFGMCIGWPRSSPRQKPRMPAEAVIHHERYDESHRDEMLTRFDESLREHYRSGGKPHVDAAWTEHIAREFSRLRRGNLRSALADLGFPSK